MSTQRLYGKSITFQDIAEAVEKGDRALVNELSLSRLYQHVQNSSATSFGIVSAWQQNNPNRAQNLADTEDLKQQLRSWGLGYNPLSGNWADDLTKIVTSEPSFFVTNISRAQILDLMNKYQQQAVIYSGPDTDGNVMLLTPSGEDNLGSFHPNRVAQGYSSFDGETRSFTFEAKPYGWSESLVSMVSKRKVTEAFDVGGYWISPTGDMVEVPVSHISDIISDPERFGLTRQEIQAQYDLEGESFGSEGKARETLVIMALRAGWIRVRNYRNSWGLQVWGLDSRKKDSIWSWASGVVSAGRWDTYAPVVITDMENSRTVTPTIKQISKDFMFEGKKASYYRSLKDYTANKPVALTSSP